MNHTARLVITLSVILLTAGGLHARGKGTSAAWFLKVPAGARPAAMGGAFTAVADDPDAVDWNPAGLIQADRPGVLLSHNEWLGGVKHEHASLALPLGGPWAAGGSVNLYRVTGLVERDIYGRESGRHFAAGGTTAAAGIARLIGTNCAAGIAVRNITESLDTSEDSVWAFDAGLLASSGRLTAGLAARNIGPGIALGTTAFPLPFTWQAGLRYDLSDRLLASLDLALPADDDATASAGVEFFVTPALALRAGSQLSPDPGTGPGLSAGAAVRAGDCRIDYAFVPCGDLAAVHRFSLSCRFGRDRP